MKHYFPIPDSPKELKIEADYALGGTNYFSYKQEARGLYVHFRQVERSISSGGFATESFELMGKGNFKMLAMPLGRKSQKRLDDLNAYVETNKDLMAELYLAGNFEALHNLVRAFNPANQTKAA